jgi:hypothetical protein
VSIERAHAELLSLALVGAKAGVRAAPTLSELTPALALRLQHVAGMDAPPGQTVLRAAALIQQLLVMPNAPSTQALPEPQSLPCPAETRAPLNADACAVMQQALLEKSALLEEFVLYAAQQQLRVPEHLTFGHALRLAIAARQKSRLRAPTIDRSKCRRKCGLRRCF